MNSRQDSKPRSRSVSRESLTPYPGGRDEDAARSATGHQGSFAKLSSNEAAEGPFTAALAAIQEALAATHRYPDNGARALKIALADFHRVGADEILIAAGGSGVLRHLATALLEPGDEVAYCVPTFHVYGREALQAGATPVTAPLGSDGAYDLEALERVVTRRTRLAFVCTPNNPTGGLVDDSALAGFLQALPPHVLPVIDEAYFEYVESPQYPDPVRIRRLTDRRAVIVRTFSKIYGLAGLRIGYAVAPPDIVAVCQNLTIPYEVNRLAQAAALATLGSQEEVIRRRSSNSRQRARLTTRLAEIGLQSLPSQANFLCIKVGQAGRVARALESHGVIVRPLDAMGDPTSIRVTLGREAEMDRFIDALTIVTRSGALEHP